MLMQFTKKNAGKVAFHVGYNYYKFDFVNKLSQHIFFVNKLSSHIFVLLNLVN